MEELLLACGLLLCLLHCVLATPDAGSPWRTFSLEAAAPAPPPPPLPCARPGLGDPRPQAARTPGDDGFRIRVVGRPEPEGYSPGGVYTVAVESTFPGRGFRGFQLVAVPQYARDETTRLGHFQHLDTQMTRFSARCPHVIMHTGSWVKGRADVLWTAPPSGAGCIEFRATVFSTLDDLWLQDDGALTKQFCEQGN